MASIKRRPDGRWRARYRDDQDRKHSRHFDRKIDGETWLAEQTVAVATGAHVSPRLSKITVQAFYDDWSDVRSGPPAPAPLWTSRCAPQTSVAFRSVT